MRVWRFPTRGVPAFNKSMMRSQYKASVYDRLFKCLVDAIGGKVVQAMRPAIAQPIRCYIACYFFVDYAIRQEVAAGATHLVAEFESHSSV